MAEDRVLTRISAWEAAGLIDHATAARLREAEDGAQPRDAGSSVLRPLALGFTATELFAFLGGGFLLGAWYALVATSPFAEGERSGVMGAAALLAAAVLVVVALAIARRDDRGRRAAGVALATAIGNLGSGVFLVLDQLRPEGWADAPANALVAWIVALVAAFGFRGWLPALTTQAGLAVTAAGTGWAAMGWLDAVLFPPGSDYQPASLDPGAALLRVGLTMGWWWLVAAGMALVLLLLDRAQAADGRHTLGRAAVGLTAVGGTTMGVLQRHEWTAGAGLAGQPVLEPFVGAAVLLVVSAVFVGLAVWRASTGYLWPAGLGVFIALTDLNAEYLWDGSGLWVALLAEAVVLFAVAYGIRLIGVRISHPGGTPPPTSVVGSDP